MLKPSQQSTTFKTGFTRVTEEVRADVAKRHEMRRFEIGGDCSITATTKGKLSDAATSSYDLPSPTLKPPLGRNEKPKRGRAAPGPLEHKI